ncbi:hypothetical protein ACWFPY_29980 [Nocardia fluminea]|uniref:hypothetical protein n=1 Tax=Nocardia fluminea TaxID=134984 RepID=UPI0033D9D6FD
MLCTFTAVAATVAAVAAVTSPPAHATEFACPDERSAGFVTGFGPGGTDSGPNTILGFQDAYYVTRSAEQAKRFLTPEFGSGVIGERLQAGIDAVAPDTRHCVRMTLLDIDIDTGSVRWQVDLTEHVPGADPATVVFVQTVITRTHEGVSLISDIAPA